MKKQPSKAKSRKVQKRSKAGAWPTYTVELAAQLSGTEPELIRYYHVSGILHAHGARLQGPVFDDDAIYELRRLEHYRRHLGANRDALVLIGRLLREVARLKAEVSHWARA
jgi:hypothetical protein